MTWASASSTLSTSGYFYQALGFLEGSSQLLRDGSGGFQGWEQTSVSGAESSRRTEILTDHLL